MKLHILDNPFVQATGAVDSVFDCTVSSTGECRHKGVKSSLCRDIEQSLNKLWSSGSTFCDSLCGLLILQNY